jgi:hypothetical protein
MRVACHSSSDRELLLLLLEEKEEGAVRGLWNGFLVNGESGEGTRGRRAGSYLEEAGTGSGRTGSS